MDTILAACQNGHRVRASVKQAGTAHDCPRCGSTVRFPGTSGIPGESGKLSRPLDPRKEVIGQNSSVEKDPLSDTGVMRILGEIEAPANAAEPNDEAREDVGEFPCPRCQVSIRANSQVCEHCQCYVGAMPEFMGRLISKLGIAPQKTMG